MEREQFTFYRSYFEAIHSIKNVKDRAAIYDAIADYALNEVEPSLSNVPLAIFKLVKPTLDAARNKAQNRINKKTNQEQNGNKRETKHKQKRKEKEGEREKESEKEEEGEREREKEEEGEREREREDECPLPPTPSSKKPTAKKPTAEEVNAYAKANGLKVDGARFVDYYAQQGWKLSNGNPLKDWQAAVRNWARRNGTKQDDGKSKEWMKEYD